MKRPFALLLLYLLAAWPPAFAALPAGTDANSPLLQLGCLDVTQAPYLADPTGKTDSTQAIQRAVNDARDAGLVCFFPEGTYLISDTLSCEQKVQKLDQPRNADGTTQHYWDVPHRIVMFGSTKGKRPVLKLAPNARGFGDPANPKILVWIWAQTRNDARGKSEPTWGEEQPNIAFGHFFRGIDLDIRGHAGAIGIRHSGSQGSAMFDSTILAEEAFSGMNNCCGQGGGTYNIEVIGGRHAIVIEPNSRFPILTGCDFRGQTDAAITYAKGGSQVPTMLVGCRIESSADAAIDLTTQRGYGGLNLIDCVIQVKPGGVLARTKKSENLFLENTHVRGATSIQSGGKKLPATTDWTHVTRYSAHLEGAVNLVNGTESTGELHDWAPAPVGAPPFAEIRSRHYRRLPSFEDKDAINVKSFGAKGDGATDDTAAFAKAIAAHNTIFVPKGNFRVTGTLALRPNTQVFGLTGTFSSIGSGGPGGRGGGEGAPPGAKGRGGKRGATTEDDGEPFTLVTVDDPAAAPGLSLLSLRGRVDWRSGQGTLFLARSVLTLSGHGGGRFYGVMGMGRQFVLSGVTQPTAFYALNVERVFANPQSEFKDCAHLRIYYFKVEAGTVRSDNAGDGNTPGRITRSRDVHVYCMVGNVRHLGELPMLEVVDSEAVVVSQVKAFQPSTFAHLIETRGPTKHTIPSSQPVAIFVRDSVAKP
jgi:hypothetical protein